MPLLHSLVQILDKLVKLHQLPAHRAIKPAPSHTHMMEPAMPSDPINKQILETKHASLVLTNVYLAMGQLYPAPVATQMG